MRSLHVALIASLILPASLLAMTASARTQRNTTGIDSSGSREADQELGKRFQVSADELPKPYATPAVRNAPIVLPFAGQTPTAPKGFTVAPFAVGLTHPRRLLVLPNGDVTTRPEPFGASPIRASLC
jgi:glucose/arabinose dehydrogenase